ncbi:alpha/beta fold hydrolase [Chryseobacterium sp. Hurlbut01]|jgi:pimeloyl-ACP methyl ester carboxylesterase|uniref:alpha/beta fold hydrolase n=1 Tax=Chryseobacterium sp. Hurlbut01 TaxID=1681828 RepID=UPI00067DBA0F|nr:alpha/beta hydrolase [Chryseobacterium sp. Hurlbut01]KNB60708.1 arylesterase [Chryseobacterium sp. Hurlbut01]
MPYTTKQNEKNYQLYYEDFGHGQPIILIHGWPLSGKSWEAQVPVLLELGYRVISYDRRGFGKSSPTADGYDYDRLTADLHELITELELKNVILFGFSMGGGEVVRYLTNYGSENIDKVALISSIIPIVKQKEDNPNGVPQDDLNEIMENLKKNRVTFLETFHKNFYNYGLLSQTVSQAQLDYDWSIASCASPIATIKCAESWANTDFRPELSNVNVKTLIVHGDDDQIVPIDTAGRQAAEGISNNEFVVIEGAPHGLNVTHADQLNSILANFLTTN